MSTRQAASAPVPEVAKPAATGLLQRTCACGNEATMGSPCRHCLAASRSLQRKHIGLVNDPLEAEADRVADIIAASAHAAAGRRPPSIPHISRVKTEAPDVIPVSVEQTLASPSSPLEPALRRDMEDSFGRDFSRVRVHSDSAAANAARATNALAFTVGNNIVFGVGSFTPQTVEGRRLIAHELTHVVQQGASNGIHVQRDPDPDSPAKLTDPISGNELADFGFYSVGPNFSGPPAAEEDIRRVLIETGIADAKTLVACTVRQFQLKGGDPIYFAYVHPSLGVIARAYGSIAGKTAEKSKKPELFYGVFAYISGSDATKYRPLGGSAEWRTPIPVIGAMTGAPAGALGDLHANLRLLEARLEDLAKRYPKSDKVLGQSIEKAKVSVADLRKKLVGGPEQAQTIETAVQLVEWADYDLKLIEQQRAQLVSDKAPLKSVEVLRRRYGRVIENLLSANAMELYEDAQLLAERLPIDMLLDALRAHGQLNEEYLADSEILVNWVDDIRKRLDAVYSVRKALAVKPDAKLAKKVETEAAFLDPAVRGIQLFAQPLVAFEQFIKAKPGVLDTPLIKAMNKLRERVHAIKAAYDAHDTALLKKRVDSLENDPAVTRFYKALPAAMQVTGMIGRIGVTTLAAMATGGVAGLLSGGARATATGLTVRGALTFAGTTVLEAATFTVVHGAASKLFFDDKITFGSLLKDFAWNIGLFGVLRGVSKGTTAVLRAGEMQILNAPVQLAVGFPFAHGWGVLRFRAERNRWPTSAELDQMTAESVLLMAGIAVGSRQVQSWLAARKQRGALTVFYREYGWRFEALETLRTDLSEQVKTAELAGKGNDKTELDSARAKAEIVEKKFQELLDTVLKDKRIQIPQIREELNTLRKIARNVSADLLADVLGIPHEVGIHRAGKASFTYANGKTTALEAALARDYTVTKKIDPSTGLKTVTATKANAPSLLFQERSTALDFDPRVYDVQKLHLEFSLTSIEAQKMLWRMLSESGIARDAKQATTSTRQKVKQLAKKSGKSADETLSELYNIGRVRSGASKAVVATADKLEAAGILKSAEWLEARGTYNQRGVVGEWLAKEAMPASSGGRTFRRATVSGDLFEDAAGTKVATSTDGKPRVNVTVAETDLIHARDASGAFEVETVINVKVSGEKGQAKSAAVQNKNFEAVLTAKPGDLAKLQLAEGVRYARITSIQALEGATLIDLTGKLRPASGMGSATVGPKGAGGFTHALSAPIADLTSVTEILGETQLIRSGEY